MEYPGKSRKRRKVGAMIALGVLLFFCAGGIAFSSGDGGHGEAKGWVETDTYRVMNFTVLIAGLFFLLKKPVSQALDNRIKGIKEQLTDLEAKKEKAEKEVAQYQEKLSLLDKEAEKIVEEYIRQGKEAKERILKEAETAAQRLEEQAHRNIEHEFAQVRLKVQQDIFEKALAKAEEVVRGNITTDDQERLVDEYLKKVVA
jgi:F-type H+-transporting ATPase subunit b